MTEKEKVDGGKYDGECLWCGTYGHRANECRKKTAAQLRPTPMAAITSLMHQFEREHQFGPGTPAQA